MSDYVNGINTKHPHNELPDFLDLRMDPGCDHQGNTPQDELNGFKVVETIGQRSPK